MKYMLSYDIARQKAFVKLHKSIQQKLHLTKYNFAYLAKRMNSDEDTIKDFIFYHRRYLLTDILELQRKFDSAFN